MGFFKTLFKKKKGGTFFGNLIRGAANKATGGILGNGVQLAKNDAKIEQREYNQAVQAQVQKQLRASQAYQAGQTATPSVVGKSANLRATLPGESDTPSGKTDVGAWLKKNWYFVAGPVGLIVVVVLAMKAGKSKLF